MIRLADVSFSYTPDRQPVFRDLALRFDHLSWVAITGPVGAGKTTLGKLIKGLLSPNSGSIVFDDSLMNGPNQVGYVGGDPYDGMVGVTVEEDVAFGLENLGVSSEEIRKGVDQALSRIGMTGKERRLVHTLSGGEQQGVALAGILAMGMKVLILDECMTMLDRPTRASVRSLLVSLRRNPGLTIIQATNDFEDILTADRVLFLAGGEVRFDGPPVRFISGSPGIRWTSMMGGAIGLGNILRQKGLVPPDCTDLHKMTAFLASK